MTAIRATPSGTTAECRAASLFASLLLGALGASESGRSGPGGGSGEALRVTVTLSTDTGERNHAHVHDVTCAEYRDMSSYSEHFGTVVDTLRDLNGGESDTVLRGVSVADRTTGRFSINVHKQAHPYDVIACGDIPQP